MKYSNKKILSFIMAVLLFVLCPLSVYAAEPPKWEGGLGLQLYYHLDEVKQYIKETKDFWVYAAHQLGAIVKADFTTFMNNSDKFDELCGDNKVGLYKDEAGNIKGVYLSKEFMAQLKALLDEYAKENEPYYMMNTLSLDDFGENSRPNYKKFYDTAKNLLEDSPSGVIALGAYYYRPWEIYFVDIGHDFRDLSAVKSGIDTVVSFYNNETWNIRTYEYYYLSLGNDDPAVKTAAEFKEKASEHCNWGTNWDNPISRSFLVYKPNGYITSFPYDCRGTGNKLSLITKERRRIRVFNTYGDFQNFTLGKRKVYYTENYYNYVPEDLSVSIDDLQKEIDDLSKVIDELLKQIGDDTSEKEIEELLKKILEELRNGQGTGGGSGGGDVTVDIDLTTTNSWLSKIYTKVSAIFDKLLSSAGKTFDDVVKSIDDLSAMLKRYLAEITGDLDDIKSQLKDMSEEEFNEKSDSFMNESVASFSEISEVANTKFPFSLPNDMRILISKLSPPRASEPEAAIYSTDAVGYDRGIVAAHTDMISVMAADEGGVDTDMPVLSPTGAPIFYIPFVIASAGIDCMVVIDMSGFDELSKLSRTLFTLMFMLCLYNLTFKVIGLWRDLVS